MSEDPSLPSTTEPLARCGPPTRARRPAPSSQKPRARRRLVFFEARPPRRREVRPGARALGEVIVAEGRVTRAQLEEATRFIRSGPKLGHILVELGYLKSGQIETYVRRQIIRIASAMLTSKSERLAFPTVVPIEAVDAVAGFHRGRFPRGRPGHLTDVDLYRENAAHRRLRSGADGRRGGPAPGMNLTPTTRRCSTWWTTGTRSGRSCSGSGLAEKETVRLLVALHQSGIVELRRKEERGHAGGGAPPGPPRGYGAAASIRSSRELIPALQRHAVPEPLAGARARKEREPPGDRPRLSGCSASVSIPRTISIFSGAIFQEKLSFRRHSVEGSLRHSLLENLDEGLRQYRRPRGTV